MQQSLTTFHQFSAKVACYIIEVDSLAAFHAHTHTHTLTHNFRQLFISI